MKLSHLTIGILLMSSAPGKAQTNQSVKQDTSRSKLSSNAKSDLTSRDTVISSPVKKIPERYCCGKCGKG